MATSNKDLTISQKDDNAFSLSEAIKLNDIF